MKFTKKAIEEIPPASSRQTFFDDAVTGLAVKVTPAGNKSFYYCYRAGKGRGAPKKQVQLGTFPDMTVDQARNKARMLQAQVVNGHDPAIEIKAEKKAIRMDAALNQFLDEYVSKLKAGTITSYTAIINRHLAPKMGRIKVKDLAYSDVATLHHEMRGTPYLANRAVGVLSVFGGWCELNGYREKNSSPTHGIKKYAEPKRMVFMGERELIIFGDTLDRMERTWHERQTTGQIRPAGAPVDAITPQSAAIIRVLLFTGARKGEILSLKWSYLDLDKGTATLPDSKTGFKVIQLPAPALAILERLPRVSEYVFPSTSATGHQVNMKDAWRDVLTLAGLSGWRPHDMRHAFASMMVNGGASLPIVGKILGHTQATTTQRYAHLETNPARKAAEDAAAKIAEALKAAPREGIIPFKPWKAGGE
jgi:integrase